MKRIASLVAVFAFILSAVAGLNATAQQGSGMGTPMAGEAQGMSMGAFYLTITNTGDAADRLVSVQTDVAGTAEIHDVVMDGGVMQMMPQLDGVEIPAGGELVLEPGGYHVMLIGLTQSLLAGDEFTATLTFENAGDVAITVPVFVGEPDVEELAAEPVEAGDLVLDGIWARQAPKIDDTGTAMASPAAGCPMGGQGSGMHAGECPFGTPGASCPMGTPGAGMGQGGMHGQGGMQAGECPYGTPGANCPMGGECPYATPGAGQGQMGQGGMGQGQQTGHVDGRLLPDDHEHRRHHGPAPVGHDGCGRDRRDSRRRHGRRRDADDAAARRRRDSRWR